MLNYYSCANELMEETKSVVLLFVLFILSHTRRWLLSSVLCVTWLMQDNLSQSFRNLEAHLAIRAVYWDCSSDATCV